MPKQKTHKGCKKRFRVTAKGKVKHRLTGTSHRLSRMTQKRKRNLRGTGVLCDLEARRIKQALGNTFNQEPPFRIPYKVPRPYLHQVTIRGQLLLRADQR